jgi:hypothetical protein
MAQIARARRPRGAGAGLMWLATPASAAALALMVIAGHSATLRGQASTGEQKKSGVYLETTETRLEAAMAQITTEGIGASMATMGFKKPKMISKLGGDKASLRVAAQPSFLFVFAVQSRTQAQMMEDPMGAMSALPQNTSSPKDFSLIKLTLTEGDRVYNSGNQQTVKFTVENVAPKTFRVKPAAALEPGEYGFANLQNGAAGMIWDFGVDGASTPTK